MKKLIAILFALLITLNLCACDVNAPTTDPTETTVVTTPADTTVVTDPTGTTDVTEPAETAGPTTDTTIPNLTGEAEQKLLDIAVGYNWPESAVDIIRTSVPDFETFDTIESKGDGKHFIIVMTDEIRYKLEMDDDGVVCISADVESVTENDIFYIR